MKSNLALFAAILLAGPVAACSGDIVADDLSPAELAALPDAPGEVDPAELAAQLAAEPEEVDAATFETDDTLAFDDEAVVDADDPVEPDSAGTIAAKVVPLLHAGLHPRASAALRAAGVSASRISQTIGNAAASAGVHKQDGTVNGRPYCAATDISVRGMSATQIRHLLERLGRVGFAAWYRQPGHDGWPSYDAPHIHAVYANAKMKAALRSQVHAWEGGRTGLVGDGTYHFYKWTSTAIATVRAKFAQSGHGTTNGGSSCVVGGSYCGGDRITGSASTLYRCTGTGAPLALAHCSAGCVVRSGKDDACR
jgi:hypothetical protein